MHMAPASSTRNARTASRTQSKPGRSQRSTKPLRPLAKRTMLVIGPRTTETAALALAFEGHDVAVTVVPTKQGATAALASQRWKWVMLDARWEGELIGHAREVADAVRCYVVDSKRVYGEHYQAIPLAQADVEALLGA